MTGTLRMSDLKDCLVIEDDGQYEPVETCAKHIPLKQAENRCNCAGITGLHLVLDASFLGERDRGLDDQLGRDPFVGVRTITQKESDLVVKGEAGDSATDQAS
jgi:hypothetical protein